MRQPSPFPRVSPSRNTMRRCLLALAALLGLGSGALIVGPAAMAQQVGNPYAPGLVTLLQDEITSGLRTRGIAKDFAQFCRYAGSRLDATAGAYSGSEINGICRLRWYDQMLRNPLHAIAEAERFTRELHDALRGDHRGLDRALVIARSKMDCTPRRPRSFPAVKSPEQALEVVKEALAGARVGHAAAFSTLTRGEVNQLWQNLYPVLTSQSQVGHTINDRGTGQWLCGLLQKVNRDGLYAAADAFAPLADPELLKQLGALAETGDFKEEGVTGTIVQEIITPGGKIIVGGKGKNTYQLDKIKDVSVVIDLGGDDAYFEGTCNFERPVLIVIDLAGNDAYRGTQPGIQGGAILGISLLLDAEGNDVYQAADVAQGSCLGGVGILIDCAGDDRYVGVRRVQGQALGGLGILVDRQGSDDYRAALWAQGLGGPLGFGVLDDVDGKDHYYVGGLYRNSYYPETPGYEGWGQGVGGGIRQVACGGIGVILDGGGDDDYEYDYIGHGGGYWLGMGFARDFGGNDRRLGATLKAYHGGERSQERFQRLGTGFGCHYALGFCFDDEGNDSYYGTMMGLGHGWDLAVGVLCDFGGNDRYEASPRYSSTLANGAQASLGVLFDYDGDDVYQAGGQGFAPNGISYHRMPECGGNFSFLVDYGGKDSYSSGARDNALIRRGSENGFLIDRPKHDEAQATEASQRSVKTKTADEASPGT